MSEHEDRAEFTAAWQQDAPRVTAYVRRQVPPAEVDDVVAETFLQAWRRWDDVPRPPLAWLIGAARKVVGNHRRGMGRRADLAERVALLTHAARPAEDAGLLAATRLEALEALAALPERQREALLLVAWDGLSPDEAARALGIRTGTLRVRMHRARTALERDGAHPGTATTPLAQPVPATPSRRQS